MQATRLHFVTSVLLAGLRWIFKLKFTSQRWRCVEVMRISYTWNIQTLTSQSLPPRSLLPTASQGFHNSSSSTSLGEALFHLMTCWYQPGPTHTHDFLAPDRSASIVAGSGKFPIRREPLGTRRDTYQSPNAWPPQFSRFRVGGAWHVTPKKRRAAGRRKRKLSQNGLKFSTPEGTNCCRKLNWIKKRMINWYGDGGWYASELFSAAHPMLVITIKEHILRSTWV